MFFHEKREKPGEYGPTSEKNITSSGTVELSAEEWKDFLTFLKKGKVCARNNTAVSGDSGPWTFLNWKNDKGKYQTFEFQSYEIRLKFEEFCSALARKEK